MIMIGLTLAIIYSLLYFKCSSAAENECKEPETEFLKGKFPPKFMWGQSTSAYQIEGGWNASGKGESIWDFWTHTKNGTNIPDSKNGDVACDSYNKYQQDIAILQNILPKQNSFYRFSIAWTRIIPTGRLGDKVNQAGIDYYNKLINGLLAAGIQPFATLFHWDEPKKLLDEGGWLNETIVGHFEYYANVTFAMFGDRVKHWITFNEPYIFCTSNWNYGERNPFFKNTSDKRKPYVCALNVIKAHAKAYRLYETNFKKNQGGEVGISLDAIWPIPANKSDAEDRAAVNKSLAFYFGLWASPIVYGVYPNLTRSHVGDDKLIPPLNKTWKPIIKNSADFLGVNHYFSKLVKKSHCSMLMMGDAEADYFSDLDWDTTGMGWPIVPCGFRSLLRWVHRKYKKPIYVTENGYGGACDEELDDWRRAEYFKSYINEMLKAILLDGADIRGYAAWSLMDNFEWSYGYTMRFGTHYINFSDPNLTRIPKNSVQVLKKIFEDNGFS